MEEIFLSHRAVEKKVRKERKIMNEENFTKGEKLPRKR